MNIYDATEYAYKNGYEAGVKELEKRLKENVIPTFTPKGIVTVEGINRIVSEMKENIDKCQNM